MKNLKFILFALLLSVATGIDAKDIKTAVFTTQPQIHCSNCENKIKGNLKFEKGVKDIVTNLEDKTITIKYDADKTSVEKLIEAFAKIDFAASIYAPAAEAPVVAAPKSAGGCCGSGGCKCSANKSGGCGCAAKKAAAAATGTKVAYFKAVQMGCGGCAAKVKRTLIALDGVDSVLVDLSTKSVRVEYDAAKIDVDKIKAGFATIKYASQLYYPDEANVAYASFLAEQIKCGGCAAKVKKTLLGNPAVKDVTVCLPTKVVSVAYDSNAADVAQLLDTFKTINYTVTEVYNKK